MNIKTSNSKITIQEKPINSTVIKIPAFTEPDLRKNTKSFTSPIECFSLFFPESLFDTIAKMTENYAHKSNDKEGINFHVSSQEIKLFLCIYIYSSVVKTPDLFMLWKQSKYLSTIIPKLITRYKFRLINKFLHISDYEENERVYEVDPLNRIKKFSFFLNHCNNVWKKYYNYSKFLTVDECISSFKGRICFRQYIKDKKKKCGVKFFSKSSSFSGYVYELIPYTGKNFEYDKDKGLGPSVLINFAKVHAFNDTHFTFDNYYASTEVLLFLEEHKIKYTCTLNPLRKCFPNEIRETKLMNQYEKKLFSIPNTNINFLLYKSTKLIHLSSNVYSANNAIYYNRNNQQRNKPEMVAMYNLTKAGVDLIDATTSIYSCQRKTYKWWKAVFYYLFDITIYNSLIVFNSGRKKPLRMVEYRQIIYENIFDEYCQLEKPSINDIVIQVHFPIKNKINNKCVICEVCTTDITCSMCKINICENCFQLYNHKGNVKIKIKRNISVTNNNSIQKGLLFNLIKTA